MTDQEFIQRLRDLLAEYDAPEVPANFLAPTHDALAAALLDPAVPVIELDPAGTYFGIDITRSVTLLGNGASLVSPGRPAIHVLPGTANVLLQDLRCTSP